MGTETMEARMARSEAVIRGNTERIRDAERRTEKLGDKLDALEATVNRQTAIIVLLLPAIQFAVQNFLVK